jgi:hypothetical protein
VTRGTRPKKPSSSRSFAREARGARGVWGVWGFWGLKTKNCKVFQAGNNYRKKKFKNLKNFIFLFFYVF